MATTALGSAGQVRQYVGYGLGQAPSVAAAGSEYFDITEGIWYVFDGTNWIMEKRELYALGHVEDLLTKQNELLTRMHETLEIMAEALTS